MLLNCRTGLIASQTTYLVRQENSLTCQRSSAYPGMHQGELESSNRHSVSNKEIQMGVRTNGCHHMAFVTNDMEGTVKFYNGVLGFPIVVTLQLPNTDP